jgi:hypothetical protein
VKRVLVCFVGVAAAAVIVNAQTAVTVQIDAAAGRHPIDARIYGLAHTDNATLADLRVPIHRWGGNVSTRYNWQANASNRASDWYFESIADGGAVASESADNFVSQTQSNGGQPLITIPMAGWVAKVGATRNNLASFSVAKYGSQTGTDSQWFADAGNGISSATGQPIAGNDANDANVASNATFQRGWIQHFVTRFGTSANTGIKYYALDNEPSIWHTTHRDIHPNGATMDEVYNAAVAYGTQIKSVDPGALIMGPEEWGWSGYFYSGADQQWGGKNGWNNLPDRTAHANADYLPWYLQQLRARDAAAGQRLLDIFTVHYYPQGGQYGNDTSTTMQQLRNRSTRALWDPSYTDESWIGTQVQLIPRLKGWVSSYYPGTKVGITEYNWGAEGHINGATTQADILGIFGREGLDVATFWTAPAASSPTYKAFKMYRNYDGAGAPFGDTSVSAVVPNPDQISVFAAQRTSDGALTLMAINKDLTASPSVNLRMANFTSSGAAQVWRLTSSNSIARLADATVSSSAITATLPAQSITLFVVPGSAGGTPQAPAAPTNLRIVGASTPSGPSSIAASSGTPQSTTVLTAFGTALGAIVRDASSNPVSGVTVTFTAPSSGATAKFGSASTTTAVTNSSGIATASALTATATTGAYTVTASVSGVATPASFSLTNTVLPGGSGTGTWVNVTPGGVDLTNDLDCGNYGTISMVADPARPSNLYTLFFCQGVWKSTDYGQTWSGPINTGSGGAGAKGAGGLAIAPGASGQPPILYAAGIRGSGTGFWKSTDGGVSWTNYNVAPGGGRQDFYPPVVDPYNPNHLVMNGHEMNMIVQSTDGGRNWTSVPMNGGMNENGGTGFLFFINTGNASTTANTWIWSAQASGGSIGTWRTTNGGGSWTKVDNNEHPHGEMQIYQPDTSGVVYMAGIYSAGGWGVIRSSDYGQTWSHVGASVGEAIVFGTPNKVYSMYAWACGKCTVGTAFQVAGSPGTSGWTTVLTPPGMGAGPAQAAVVFDGSRYVIVTANWLSGLWRYVE